MAGCSIADASDNGVTLKGQIVAIAATPTGNGYRLAGSDGGVFLHGDATSAEALPGS